MQVLSIGAAAISTSLLVSQHFLLTGLVACDDEQEAPEHVSDDFSGESVPTSDVPPSNWPATDLDMALERVSVWILSVAAVEVVYQGQFVLSMLGVMKCGGKHTCKQKAGCCHYVSLVS